MNNRFKFILLCLTITVCLGLIIFGYNLYHSRIEEQNRLDAIKNCIPRPPGQLLDPPYDIHNNTHWFDFQDCKWKLKDLD